MLGKETSNKNSTSPSNSFIQRALHTIGAATMPLPISNSLQSRSPRRNLNFSRLNSTGEAIEDNQQEKSVESPPSSSSSVYGTFRDASTKFCHSFSMSSCVNTSPRIGSMSQFYSPHRTLSGPACSSSSFVTSPDVPPSEGLRASSSVVDSARNFSSVGLRMASSCSSLPVSVGVGLVGGNKTAPTASTDTKKSPKPKSDASQKICEKPTMDLDEADSEESSFKTSSKNLRNSLLSQSSSGKIENFQIAVEDLQKAINVHVINREPDQYSPNSSFNTPPSPPQPSPEKGFSDQYNTLLKEHLDSTPKISPKKKSVICNCTKQEAAAKHCRRHMALYMSSDSEMENLKHVPRSNLSAMATVSVTVESSSPEKSPRKKQRPSSKKRRRHQQQRASGEDRLGAQLTSQTQQKQKPSHSSDSSQTPQSFTITLSDVSSADTSIDVPQSPPKKPSLSSAFFIRPGLDSESEESEEDDREKEDCGSPLKTEKSKPGLLFKLNVAWEEESEDEMENGKSPIASNCQPEFDSSEESDNDKEEDDDGKCNVSLSSPKARSFLVGSLFLRPETDSESEESDEEDDVSGSQPAKKQGTAGSRFFRPSTESESDDESEDDAEVDRSKPSKNPSICAKMLAHIRFHTDSESKSSETGDNDEEGWDEEDDVDGANNDEWESMCNKVSNFGLFACSLSESTVPDHMSSSAPEVSIETEKKAAEDLPKEVKAAMERWEAAYGEIKPEESKPTKVCFPDDPCEFSVVYVMFEWSNANVSTSAEVLDKERFKRRISDVNEGISHVFASAHRARIYKERFSDSTEKLSE